MTLERFAQIERLAQSVRGSAEHQIALRDLLAYIEQLHRELQPHDLALDAFHDDEKRQIGIDLLPWDDRPLLLRLLLAAALGPAITARWLRRHARDTDAQLWELAIREAWAHQRRNNWRVA